MSARDDIAEALNRVADQYGITGSPTTPLTPTRGSAWPEWQRSEPSNLTGDWLLTWQVHLVLPAGREDATALEADRLVDDVAEQLELVGAVSSIEPTTLVIQQGAQQLPCLTYTLTTG